MGIIIALLVAGVVLLLLEIFLPGGVIGAVGLVLVFASVIMGFIHDPKLGAYMLAALLVLGPIALWAWVKYFPGSRFAKPLMLQENAADWHGFDNENNRWLGKSGIAKTDLHPSGNATIEGERVDVITQGEMIDRGTPVRVIAVQGNRVIVAEQEITNESSSDQTHLGASS